MSRWQHFWQWWHGVHWAWKVLGLILIIAAIIFVVVIVVVAIYAVVAVLVYLFGGGLIQDAVNNATNQK